MIANSERQLGNESYLAKAPANVVEGLRRQDAENRILLKKAREALDALPPESGAKPDDAKDKEDDAPNTTN